MNGFGFDPEALIQQFADATAKQGEAVRRSVHDATLKALQGRELTLKNIKAALAHVSSAAAEGAMKNPMGADKIEPLLSKAVSGMDDALLQAVEANRRALQQLVQYGADIRENQIKKVLADIEQMEDTFFSTVRKTVTGNAGPMQSAWSDVLEKTMLKGSGTGARATQTVQELTEQAQSAMRSSRAAGMKVAQTLLDSYAALASGVLIGMSEGMKGGGGAGGGGGSGGTGGAASKAASPAAPAKKAAAKKRAAKRSSR